MQVLRTVRIVLVAGGLLLLPLTHAVGAEASKEATLQGEILDLACYVGSGAKGADHTACATKCLAQGQPAGLLATDGTIYLLFADHENATAFKEAKKLGGKKAEIRGAVVSKEGLKGITVHSVKAL